ncbi:MAG TPA: hypothetical protein DHW39_01760, partial [Erysipelotrichaceae bacterium]|nr:hypothetical protein [Erysipelotrichaceae bacterium]
MKQTGRFTICMLTAWMMLCMLVFPNAGTMMTKVNAAETSISLEVTYHQTDARKQLDLINAFRTAGDAWYWNSDNSTKTENIKLPALQYDYKLEEIAMQRAAEIALSFSHTRPSGESAVTAYTEAGYQWPWYGENIAAGQRTYEAAFISWREDNDDYSGQGHRRNMLNSNFGAIGIACVECGGIRFWVQEFSDRARYTTVTQPQDSTAVKTITVNSDQISGWQISPASATVLHDESGRVSDLFSLKIKLKEGWPSRYTAVNTALSWTSSDTNVMTVSGEQYTALDIGSVTLSAKTPTGTDLSCTMEVLPGYELDHWEWAENKNYAELYLKHKTLNKTYQKRVYAGCAEVTPGCEEPGSREYMVSTTYEGITYEDKVKEIIPATGHKYGTPTYTWSSDNRKVTAKAVCENNSSHIAEETVSTSYRVLVPEKCEQEGTCEYTASFVNKAFTAQTKTVVISATGHKYGTPTYTWNGDKVTAKAVCEHDSSHVITETVTATSEVTTEPTCEKEGVRTYTAAFKNSMFKTQTKTEAIPAIGHKYGTPEYTWSSDNKTATAKRVCKNDPSHVDSETVKTTYKVTVQPGCETEGEGTYTASFTNKAFTAQTKTVVIPATGHKYGTPTYTWNGDKVTAKAVCEHDSSHVITETVTATSRVTTEPTCEKDGVRTYTAAFKNSMFKTQTKTESIPAIGHKYGNPVYTWSSDNKTVTATVTCTNDRNHKITETVNTEFKVTKKATETSEGTGIYTASFRNTLFTAQTKNVTIPKITITEMYRLYNPNSGEHFYTAKAKERDVLASIGWQYEGIGWYAPKESNTPVYR